MGKLFESLRRPSDRRDTPTPAAWAPPVPLKVLPPSAEPLAPRDLWPPLSEGEAAPFVEVPEALSPAATETEASAAVVPFTPAPEAESETETARSGYAWRPAALSRPDDAWSKIAEALLQELGSRQARTLLLLPCEDASRMAELTAELAGALALQHRQPTLLVDTLRGQESAAARLHLAAAPGWEEMLLGLNPRHAVQRSGVPGLDVVAAGNRLAEATPTRWARDTGQKLRKLADRYRLLLIAAPPWPRSPLGLLLAAETDAACVAVPAASAEGVLHEQLLQLLQEDGRSVLGSLAIG